MLAALYLWRSRRCLTGSFRLPNCRQHPLGFGVRDGFEGCLITGEFPYGEGMMVPVNLKNGTRAASISSYLLHHARASVGERKTKILA
jgi:hypothetical protein